MIKVRRLWKDRRGFNSIICFSLALLKDMKCAVQSTVGVAYIRSLRHALQKSANRNSELVGTLVARCWLALRQVGSRRSDGALGVAVNDHIHCRQYEQNQYRRSDHPT